MPSIKVARITNFSKPLYVLIKAKEKEVVTLKLTPNGIGDLSGIVIATIHLEKGESAVLDVTADKLVEWDEGSDYHIFASVADSKNITVSHSLTPIRIYS